MLPRLRDLAALFLGGEMIRLMVLSGAIGFLAIYAWKDWYKSLCGLIILIAVIEHPDMPKAMFGIQGLNPWNLLLLVVLLAWVANRGREGLRWDMPHDVSVLLLLYLGVVLIGFFRMLSDRGGLEETGTGYLISEHLVNTVKWVVPGLLLFDGSRSRPRLLLGLASLLAIYLLLALQVIKWMPPSVALSSQGLSARSLKILLNEVGYSRVNLSMMLAGASWAVLAMAQVTKRRIHVVLILAASLVVVYAQGLTAGRMGYVTWAVVGLVLCVIRWPRHLPLVPLVVLVMWLLIPGAADRMFQGFSSDTRDTNSLLAASESLTSSDDDPDIYTITAGRTVAWAYVVDKTTESPIVGFGTLAMQRTGIAQRLWDEFQESFPHPHNAYLELLLDSGAFGFLAIVPFYLVVLARSVALFRSQPPLASAIGGVACSLVLALLVASFGSQTFYPREGSVGMWCAIGLLLRIYVQPGLAQGVTTASAAAPSWWQPTDSQVRTTYGSPEPRTWWQPS